MKTTVRQDAKRRFEKDVPEHVMSVKLDSGLHRHIMFKSPNCNSYWFSIVTWPGTLAINGDMGCFVFCRLPDMFEFFRSGPDINPSYWSEKCVSAKRFEYGGQGISEFDFDALVRVVVGQFREYCRDKEVPHDKRRDAWSDVRDFIEQGSQGDVRSIDEASQLTIDGEEFTSDLWDYRMDEYTFHFLWCLHAIRWAIQQYDQAKAEPKSEVCAA